jgi:hypothetical protein
MWAETYLYWWGIEMSVDPGHSTIRYRHVRVITNRVWMSLAPCAGEGGHRRIDRARFVVGTALALIAGPAAEWVMDRCSFTESASRTLAGIRHG